MSFVWMPLSYYTRIFPWKPWLLQWWLFFSFTLRLQLPYWSEVLCFQVADNAGNEVTQTQNLVIMSGWHAVIVPTLAWFSQAISLQCRHRKMGLNTGSWMWDIFQGLGFPALLQFLWTDMGRACGRGTWGITAGWRRDGECTNYCISRFNEYRCHLGV